MVPVWVVLIIVALFVDPCSNGGKICVCHDFLALKYVEPCLYHLYAVFRITVFVNGKPAFTRPVVLKVFEVFGAFQLVSQVCTKDRQFEGAHNVILAYGFS